MNQTNGVLLKNFEELNEEAYGFRFSANRFFLRRDGFRCVLLAGKLTTLPAASCSLLRAIAFPGRIMAGQVARFSYSLDASLVASCNVWSNGYCASAQARLMIEVEAETRSRARQIGLLRYALEVFLDTLLFHLRSSRFR